MNKSDDHESTQSILLQTQCHFWTKIETTDKTEIHFDLPGVGGTAVWSTEYQNMVLFNLET